MKKLLITLLLLPTFAFAQSAPFDITKGLTKYNFDQAFEKKVDTTGGTASGLIRTGGTDTGTDISAANLSSTITGAGVAIQLVNKEVNSAANSSIQLAAGYNVITNNTENTTYTVPTTDSIIHTLSIANKTSSDVTIATSDTATIEGQATAILKPNTTVTLNYTQGENTWYAN